MKSRRDVLVVLLSLLAVTSQLRGQESPVRFEGGLTLSSELYSATGIQDRRAKQSYRAIFSPTITFFDQIQLPFEFYVSNDERGFRQPFNQFGVSPTLWGWLTLHAGYFSSRLSDLSFGDARLVGGGVELSPGNFRFSVLYGKSQQSLAADTANGFRGMYERKILAAKIGYGAESEFFIHLNFVRAVDDSNSLQNAPSDNAPQENVVASLSYGVPMFGGALHITGETAVSAYSNDTRAPQDEHVKSQSYEWLFIPRYSSQLDGATMLTISVVPSQTFSVSLTGKWVGPGFVTLGYVQLPNDVLESTIAPAVRLFNNTLFLRGSFGLRYNNLRDNRLATTRRTIGSVMVNAQPVEGLSLDAQYANYGMRSTPRNDTLRIDNISQSFTLSPSYTFPSFGGVSTAMASYAIQDFSDYNTITGALSGNQSQSGTALWMIVFPSTLSLTTSAMYTSAITSAYSMSIIGINETVGHAFFDNHLSASVTLGYNIVRAANTDGQINARLSATYATGTWGSFTLSLMNNRYNYGDQTVSPSYSEAMGNLQYSFAF